MISDAVCSRWRSGAHGDRTRGRDRSARCQLDGATQVDVRPGHGGDSDGVIGTVFTCRRAAAPSWPGRSGSWRNSSGCPGRSSSSGTAGSRYRTRQRMASIERRMDEIRRNILTSGVSHQNPPYPPSRAGGSANLIWVLVPPIERPCRNPSARPATLSNRCSGRRGSCG